MKKAILIKDVTELVCDNRKINSSDLWSKSRKRELTEPRQIIWYIVSQDKYEKNKYGGRKYKTSLRMMGEYFGKRHATVLHGIKTIKNLYDTDKKIHKEIDIYLKEISYNHKNNKTNLTLALFSSQMKKADPVRKWQPSIL